VSSGELEEQHQLQRDISTAVAATSRSSTSDGGSSTAATGSPSPADVVVEVVTGGGNLDTQAPLLEEPDLRQRMHNGESSLALVQHGLLPHPLSLSPPLSSCLLGSDRGRWRWWRAVVAVLVVVLAGGGEWCR
jgi:hypothetical protein